MTTLRRGDKISALAHLRGPHPGLRWVACA